MNIPAVSIIMPSFNSEETIQAAIESVRAQTYSNWELIISDDNSSDSTVEIVERNVLHEPRIILIQHSENRGAGFSRNEAISKARGKYIAFLDSDDIWHEKKLEIQIRFMSERKLALSYTQYQKINMEGVKGKIIIPPSVTSYSELLKSNVIGCLTAVYDQEILGKMYMPLIRKRQDMALWLDILKKIEFAYCVPEVLAFYREGHNSLSSNKIKILSSQWEFYRGYLKFGIFRSAYYFSFYVFKALKKHKT
ncbi:glycosyltransferase family 2 protein [Escherichia coli]|uniref:glycosyltransferase family 2 protein n=1 Tax=Escherichia coli TaxID=562 RepID=UPI00093233A8|nr:glycosyltransferase family 2 protein [Escherichia coli]EFK3482055.1 glycosyltransferase family 2 protein [Escherichia coli]EHY5470318.1 glycosyltransferase family 2 protein [Escherichia coli]EIH4620686.1 glycosyltransferase family 2 protein [Escherichia coli]EIQ0496652.1 glycosyltransferase family 2 protein [Escherichia coli]MBN6349258.1 glycosyltransferase family 2 protein [Escherichia coli]